MSGDEVARLRATRKLPKGPLSGAEANALIELISQRLRDYPTTLEEDAVLLRDLQYQASTEISHRRRKMAIQVRKGEKEILKQLLDLLQSYVNQHTQENKRVGGDLGRENGSKRRKQ
jgi:SET domain-containing protein 6